MYTKKSLKENRDKEFEDFLSSDFSKASFNQFIDSDIAKNKNNPKLTNFWNDSDNDSSSGREIGTGKSFLKPVNKTNSEKPNEKAVEVDPPPNEINSLSESSDLRLNLHQSSDKSHSSNSNDFNEGFRSGGFAHPITFEGITDTHLERSYSPSREVDSKLRVNKPPNNGVETIKSNISTIPIDKSNDNFLQSIDRTDKEHLLSKVSLVDSFDGHKLDKSFPQNDNLHSIDAMDNNITKIDLINDSYYKNSINPASGDFYNNTQAITNITDTVIGDTTAADLAAIHKQYEKYNKISDDLTPGTNIQLSETVKDLDGDSTIQSKNFGFKQIRPEDVESNFSPTPTPRPRSKNKVSKSDNTETIEVKDESIMSTNNRKSDGDEKIRSRRYSHVKSSGYGSKSITSNKNSTPNSSKSQPNSFKKKSNEKILVPSTKINSQTFTRPEQCQIKSSDHNRSKSASKFNENKSQHPKNETYYIHRYSDEENVDIQQYNPLNNNLNSRSKEWQEKWLEERKIVKKLQADSSIQERDHRRQIENATQKYEEKISLLESQLCRVKQQLQLKPDFSNKLIGSTVTKEDITRIEKEMKDQNSILSAYEKDNERLCQEIKVLKQYKKSEDKIDSIENERLISQLVSLKAELDTKEIELRNLKQMSKDNRFLRGNGKIENNDFYLEEISLLKNELQSLNHRYLLSESDRQKAEQKLDKIIVETDKKIYQYQHELEIERIEREKMKETHQAEVEDLKRKIKWYLENQVILDQNSKKLKLKDQEIVELKNQLESANTMKISSNIRAKEKLADTAKIKQLEDEIMSLRGDLYLLTKGKNIGNIAEKRTVQFLEEKIKSLEADKNSVHDKENNAIRSLKQQFEAMKYQYEEKISDLEFDLTKRFDAKSQSEKQTRITTLRSKIEELNNELGKKSTLINKLKTDIKKLNKNNNGVHTENKSKNIRKIELDNRTNVLQNMLHEKDNEIQKLIVENNYLKSNERKEYDYNLSFRSPGQLELEAENAKYKSQIIHLSRDIENYKQTLEEIKLSSLENEELIRKECQKEIEKREEFHKNNLNNVKIDFASRHSESELANLKSEIEIQKNYINHLQGQVTECNVKLISYDKKANELTEAKEQIQNLQKELSDLRLIWSKKPGLEMIDRLRSKIVFLEERENFKSKQLDEYIDKMVKSNSKQYQDEVERWRSIVAKKNQNLLLVQHELDQLLETLEELRRQGITIPKFFIKSKALNENNSFS